jgi:(S)-ureidoglycine aminohydrolase
MQQFGHTRSAFCHDHILHTPDAFVRAPLPGMRNGTAIIHIGPARGARFTQYTAELQPAGVIAPSSIQRFVYVLEGCIEANGSKLEAQHYFYAGAGQEVSLIASSFARLAVIEKPYEPISGVDAPGYFSGAEANVVPTLLDGDEKLEVRCLIPPGPSFDFAVNIMTYQPGASLPMVEMHVMEHGLLMLQGGGIYRLGDRWYPVSAGDFIWMAPYCPQWFGALGKFRQNI